MLTQDGRVLIEEPDGSGRPARSRTDRVRVRALRHEEVEAAAAADHDALPLDEAFWREAAPCAQSGPDDAEVFDSL